LAEADAPTLVPVLVPVLVLPVPDVLEFDVVEPAFWAVSLQPAAETARATPRASHDLDMRDSF